MHLVQMSEHRSRETWAVLTYLLKKAVRGELAGVALCAEMTNGEQELLLTDAFRRSPRKASDAANRLFWHAMRSMETTAGAKKA